MNPVGKLEAIFGPFGVYPSLCGVRLQRYKIKRLTRRKLRVNRAYSAKQARDEREVCRGSDLRIGFVAVHQADRLANELTGRGVIGDG